MCRKPRGVASMSRVLHPSIAGCPIGRRTGQRTRPPGRSSTNNLLCCCGAKRTAYVLLGTILPILCVLCCTFVLVLSFCPASFLCMRGRRNPMDPPACCMVLASIHAALAGEQGESTKRYGTDWHSQDADEHELHREPSPELDAGGNTLPDIWALYMVLRPTASRRPSSACG